MMTASTGSVQMVVSVDHIHKAGSTNEKREDPVSRLPACKLHPVSNTNKVPRLQYFSLQSNGTWQEDSGLAKTFEAVERSGNPGNSNGDVPSGDDQSVRGMLYNMENLRKRPGAED